MSRIQFILKHREEPFIGEPTTDPAGKKRLLSSGLLNSANFVADALAAAGHTVEVSQAMDNNCIDRLVTKFKPDIAVIEAYWVVPEKFAVLQNLHPTVTWLIRNHSATPFLAQEGIVMDWSLRYMDYPRVVLACNDARTDSEFRQLIAIRHPDWSAQALARRCTLLSNIYPSTFQPRPGWTEGDVLEIGCFGSVRPLKNQLAQAVAAMLFANKRNKKLNFHMNGTRIEMKGEPIANNIRKMFAQFPQHTLVEHPWLPHDAFCDLLRTVDVSMQVSYSETFNIVTADALVNGVPVITSPDILWSDPKFQADPNSIADMVSVLERTYQSAAQDTYWQTNLDGMHAFSEGSKTLWLDFIRTATTN